MTLSKLAKIAGVSVSTVSKAFAGSYEISEETRERILAFAKEQGCFDKYYKAPRGAPLVALMIPEPESERYGREIGLLERAFTARGADTIIAYTRFDPEKEARLFRELVYGMKVDGVVLWGAGKEIRNPDEHPLIAIGGRDRPQNADVIPIDLDGGMLTLVRTLKEYGHKSVGFIGETLTQSSALRLKNSMREVGFPIHERFFAVSGNRFEQAGADGMRELIAKDAVPDVIVTAYGEIAYGAIKYAREHGYRVPDDVSFVGIFDSPTASCFDMPLCSLSSDLETVCGKIVDLLYKRMQNKHYRARTEITVPVRLHVRETLKRKDL